MGTFRLSEVPIVPQLEARQVMGADCGGFASFEGWVRDHNDGRSSNRLEYEAFAELSLTEGEKILEEARRKFGVDRVACVHRTGALEIGDVAVWVGAAAAHRAEAFAACRYIIDEAKHRLPLWKKEHYREGDAAWVNCEADPALTSTPSKPASDYSRQTALREVGTSGQARLRAAKVLVVGAGGLGVPVLSYLAGAGVGTIGIVDGDILEASNLHRQTIYSFDDIGKLKAELAARHIGRLNPEVRLEVHPFRLTPDSARSLIDAYEIVVDCTDNFAATFLINDVAFELDRIAVFASIHQFEGEIQVFRPDLPDSLCYRCVWPSQIPGGIVGTCDLVGTLGPVPGVLGSIQALEVLKIILNAPGQLGAELLLVDLVNYAQRRFRVPPNVGGRHESCRAHAKAEADARFLDIEISVALDSAYAKEFDVIDLRTESEALAKPLTGVASRRVSIEDLLIEATQAGERKLLLVCSRGIRSRQAVLRLREIGYMHAYSLAGGLRTRTPATER